MIFVITFIKQLTIYVWINCLWFCLILQKCIVKFQFILNYNHSNPKSMLEKVGKNFKLIRHINTGGFGSIYQGINTKTNLEVAIKLEYVDSQKHDLLDQCKLYYQLNRDAKVMDKGIPNVYYYSTEGDYNVLVMDLMGPSLSTLLYHSLGQFSLKTVLMLMDQMIVRLQFLHSNNYVHRDVKPDNFCIGLGKTAHKIYMIDLGLSTRYMYKGKHISTGSMNSFVGTSIYGSLNNHMGVEHSRRDDMECLGYSVMQFLRGNLPWQGMKYANKRQKYEMIKQKKKNISIEVLCKGHPQEFVHYITMCRNMGFDQKPPYQKIRQMFKELFERQGYKRDFRYDWIILNEKREAAELKKKGKQNEQTEDKL